MAFLPDLTATQIIEELKRRGITLRSHPQSATGFSLDVGPTGAAVPDWLISDLEVHSSEVAEQLQQAEAGEQVQGA